MARIYDIYHFPRPGIDGQKGAPGDYGIDGVCTEIFNIFMQ